MRWTQIDTDCARVGLTYQGMEQSVDIRVAADGQPTEVSFQRWSNANPEKTIAYSPLLATCPNSTTSPAAPRGSGQSFCQRGILPLLCCRGRCCPLSSEPPTGRVPLIPFAVE
ncbi:hypothetical protein [Magnetovirga frankeli]|uniref:hypothetical protein n=1 Tax=Magnetovirga frankeli TaxID=947516 RepID=UPI003D33B949